jgi:NADH-quinone oxidoreductase subunit N
LGRQVSLTPAAQIVLVLVYGMGAFWIFGGLAVGNARRLAALGLMSIALLTASLAIRPFLYAAILIQGAVLLAVFMLAETGKPAGRGLIRFLIYHTLSMPFILFAGFLLTGVEVGPRDLGIVLQAAILLGLGICLPALHFPAFDLAAYAGRRILALHGWFVLSTFPTFALLFGLNFIDRYAWIRESEAFFQVLQTVGLLTALSGGLWAAFERHAGRIFGYAAVVEIGLSLAAVSLPDRMLGLEIVFFMIVPRALAYGTWAMSLAVLRNAAPDLRYQSLQGLARQYPLAALGVLSPCFRWAAPVAGCFPGAPGALGRLVGPGIPACPVDGPRQSGFVDSLTALPGGFDHVS